MQNWINKKDPRSLTHLVNSIHGINTLGTSGNTVTCLTSGQSNMT